MKKRYIIIAVLLIAILASSIFFIAPILVDDSNANNETANQTPSETANQTPSETANATPSESKPDNQPATTPTTEIVVPEEMQVIIDENADALYVDNDDTLAVNYPTEMIPLYHVFGVSQSQAMTGVSGKPGWLTNYVSEDSTEELLAFYRPLLITMSDFSEENISESTNLKATVSGYSISLTISPNNPSRTDIQGNSAVSIFIEEV